MGELRNDIEKYLRGELTPSERHALEKRALNDPFLADALEGSESISMEDFSADVSAIRESLSQRTQKRETKIITWWSWPMRIAAGFVILIAATFAVYQISSNKNSDIADADPAQTKTSPEKETPETIVSNTDSVVVKEPVREEATPPSIASASDTKVEKPKEEDKATNTIDEHIAFNKKADAEKSAAPKPTLRSRRSEPVIQPTAPTKNEIALSEAEIIVLDSTQRIVAADQTQHITDELKGRTAGVQVNDSPALSYSVTKENAAERAELSQETRSKKSILAPATKVIKGKVTSAEDGTGMPGVNVTIKGTIVGTITDGEGNYQIPMETTEGDLTFTFIGMESQEVALGDATEVNVAMNPDMRELSEIVIVAAAIEPEDDIKGRITFASPAGGRAEFKKYVESSLKYPQQALENKVEGKVTIQFTVEPSGTITNMRVVKGIGYGCDEEVLRLITQGPRWNPTRRDDEPITGKVKVRVRFKLPKK